MDKDTFRAWVAVLIIGWMIASFFSWWADYNDFSSYRERQQQEEQHD